MHKHFTHKSQTGFTIVELLIVIVVIGILAAITIIGFNGVTRSATNSLLVSDVTSASRAVETYKVDDDSSLYPLTLGETTFSPDDTDDVTYNYNVSTDRLSYCIQASLSNRSYFYANNSSKAEPGICEDTVGVPGDGDVEEEQIDTTEMNIDGDGGGLNVAVNQEWTDLTVSWDAVSNAQRYEVQVDRGDGIWVYVNKTTGSSLATGVQTCATRQTGTWSEYCSAQIAASTTSVTWQHPHIFPVNTTGEYKYRVRAIVGGAEQQWHTVALTLPATPNLTIVKNFKIEPISSSDSTSYVLSWDSVANHNLPKARIQIQLNRNNEGWKMVNHTSGSTIATGAQTCATKETGTYSEYCTAQITPETTTLTFANANARPTNVNDVLEYRIRMRSNQIAGMYSDWRSASVTIPATNSLAIPTGFSVSQVSGWTGVTLNWTNASAINTPNAKIQIQVNRNGAGWMMVNHTTGSTIATGAQLCATKETGTYSEYCSAQISPSTSTLTWTHANARPPSAGQTYDYRMRYRSDSILGLYSDWVTASVTR